MLCCMVWGTSGMTLNKDSKTSQPSFHQSKSPTRRGKTINNLNQDREDAPLRRGGDDFWHVKIILPPWIPCSTKPWLTTALRRSVHHESSLLAFSHTHTRCFSFPLLSSCIVFFGIILVEDLLSLAFFFVSFFCLSRMEYWIELFPPHNGATNSLFSLKIGNR